MAEAVSRRPGDRAAGAAPARGRRLRRHPGGPLRLRGAADRRRTRPRRRRRARRPRGRRARGRRAAVASTSRAADGIDVAELGPLTIDGCRRGGGPHADRRGHRRGRRVCIALPSVAHLPIRRARAARTGSWPQALARRTAPRPLIVFCAENHRAAAAFLEAAVLRRAGAADCGTRWLGRARFVDTVIGKMSGVVDDRGDDRARSASSRDARPAVGLPRRGLRPHPRLATDRGRG